MLSNPGDPVFDKKGSLGGANWGFIQPCSDAVDAHSIRGGVGRVAAGGEFLRGCILMAEF